MMQQAEGLTLGVDLGGTKVEVALVDAKGQIMASHRYPTDSQQGAAGVTADIVACLKECLGGTSKEALAVGVGVAGQVDGRSGAVRFAPNLG